MKRSGLITQQAQDIVSTSNDLYLLKGRKQINLNIHIFWNHSKNTNVYITSFQRN